MLQPDLVRCPKPRWRRDDANQVIGREHSQHAIENTAFPDSNLSIHKGGGADLHLIEALCGQLSEDTSNVSSTIRVRSVYFCTMNPAPSEWP